MKERSRPQAGPPGVSEGGPAQPGSPKGPALSVRLLRKARRAWGGNINQSGNNGPLWRSPARGAPARPGRVRDVGAGPAQPAPSRAALSCGLSAVPSPGPPGTARSHPPGRARLLASLFSGSSGPGRGGGPGVARGDSAGPTGTTALAPASPEPPPVCLRFNCSPIHGSIRGQN